MSPDLINGIFESIGGFFIAFSVVKLYREKLVRGVSTVHATFFSLWGFWNLYYYPHLDQWASFWGGMALVAVNVVWVFQMLYYLRRERLAIARLIAGGDAAWQPGIPLTISANGLSDRTPLYRHNDK